MFRHQGKSRTFLHNLRLAALLSLVAGIVNITGVLALKTLTTNVTGHFAYFAEEIMRKDYAIAITGLVYVLNIVDAVVDAHLYEGRNDPDLALKPTVIFDEFGKQNSKAGLSLSYNF